MINVTPIGGEESRRSAMQEYFFEPCCVNCMRAGHWTDAADCPLNNPWVVGWRIYGRTLAAMGRRKATK